LIFHEPQPIKWSKAFLASTNIIENDKEHAVNMYGRVKVQIQTSLDFVLDGSEWSASCHRWFTFQGEPPLPIRLEGLQGQ